MVGTLFLIFCANVMWNETWVLEKTGKGQSLIRWFGRERAPWVLRGLTALGMTLGALVAAGIVRPIRW